MNEIFQIAIGIVGNAIWFALGFFTLKLLTFFRNTVPSRNLWQIFEPKQVVICAATSILVDTGEYTRPATGIGQMRALALATTSLNTAYGKLDIRNILLSTDQLQEKLENDLILLGGPKNNSVSAHFMELIGPFQPIRLKEPKILWCREKTDNIWSDNLVIEYVPVITGGKVTKDYGLIIRAQSPFTSKKRTVVLLAGTHTYGTLAAAKYFTEEFPKTISLYKKPTKNLALVISSLIIDGYPTALKLEQIYEW